MTAYILMVQWEDGDPYIAGVFSSFTKAVQYFVRTEFEQSPMLVSEMLSKAVNVALKLAHRTDDEDWSNFGRKKVWLEECEVDEHCEKFEIHGEKQGE